MNVVTKVTRRKKRGHKRRGGQVREEEQGRGVLDHCALLCPGPDVTGEMVSRQPLRQTARHPGDSYSTDITVTPPARGAAISTGSGVDPADARWK